MVEYTAEEQRQADGELGALEKMYQPCIVCGMMDDFQLMRDQCR